MRDELVYILSQVNDWLKFAETKLTVLITVNGAAIFAACQILLTIKELYIFYAISIFISLTSLSVIISLLGIIPRSKIPSNISSSSIVNGENLIFYGNISKYSPEKFLERFSQSLNYNASYSKYEEQLSQQITINSRICVWKYNVFSLSVKVSFYAFILCLEVIIIGVAINYIFV